MEPDWMRVAREKGIVREGKGVNVDALRPIPRISQRDNELIEQYLKTVNEAEFQTLVIQLAQNNGWRVAHFRKVRVQRRDGTVFWETPVAAEGKGFLDLELVKGKRLIKAELKVGKNTTTPEQEEWIAAYREAKVAVYVWYPKDWPEIVKILTAPRKGQ